MRNDLTVKILGGARNGDDDVTIFLRGTGNVHDVTITIFYLVSNGNDVTVTFSLKTLARSRFFC
jgi:hypothetical protein